jgi:hypothetical protein
LPSVVFRAARPAALLEGRFVAWCLAKLDPGLMTWLLAHLFDVKVPDYHHARAQPTDVRVVNAPPRRR